MKSTSEEMIKVKWFLSLSLSLSLSLPSEDTLRRQPAVWKLGWEVLETILQDFLWKPNQPELWSWIFQSPELWASKSLLSHPVYDRFSFEALWSNSYALSENSLKTKTMNFLHFIPVSVLSTWSILNTWLLNKII